MEAIKFVETSKWDSVILGNAHNAVFLTDDKFRYVRVNSGAVKLLGYSEQEFLNLSAQDITTECITISEDHNFLNQLNSANSQQGEVGMRKKDGTIIYCHYETIDNYYPGLRLIILVDISEQKKLKEIIAAEQLRFEKIFSEAPVSMCVLKGKQLVFESANNNYYKFTGRTDSIIGNHVIDVFPEVEEQGYFDSLDKIYATGETYSANEFPLKLDLNRDENLTQLYMNFMCQPFRDESGNVAGIFFFGFDVTEQVEARLKIEESEKRYIDLIENLPAAVYTTDPYGTLNMYNTAALKLWGRKPNFETDRWCGSLKIFDLEKNVIPNDCSPMAVSLKTGIPISHIQGIVQRPDGELRYVTPHTGLLKNKNGEIIGGVNVMIDNTDKRKAEQELHSVTERLQLATKAAKIGIWDWDIEIDKLIWDDEMYAMFNINPSEFSGSYEAWEAIVHPDDVVQVKEDIENALLGNSEFDNTFRIVWKDKSIHYIKTNGLVERNADGKAVRMLGTNWDITKEKETEENLELQNLELKKTNSELDRFVYSVSHDLRAPLTSMLGVINLSLKKSKENQTVEHLNMLKQSVNKLDGFIADILNYSQNSRLEVQKEKINLRKLLDDSWNDLKYIGGSNRQIEFVSNVDENIYIYSDKIRLSIVLNNLISNAIRYQNLQNPNPFVEIKVETTDAETHICIIDNGIGIEEEFQPKIFDMFYRVSEQSVGSGLGLYLVKESLDKLNGSIKIQSILGQGTSFIVSLPNN